MHFRFTLTLAVAVALTGMLTGVLGVWLTLDIAVGDMAPNVLFNVILVATCLSGLCTLGALRRERERQGCQQQRDRDFDAAVRQLWD